MVVQPHCVAEKRDQLIHHISSMLSHEHKRRRDANSEPCHAVTRLIARDGELPEIVRHKQRNHEDNHVLIRTYLLANM